MSTPSKSRLTWFRFNLRSLFVVMTLVACWFGWQVNTVHKRQELLRELKNKPNFSVVLNHSIALGSNRPYASVSITRRWLGDVPVHRIIVAGSLNATNSPTFRRLKQLFPEVRLWTVNRSEPTDRLASCPHWGAASGGKATDWLARRPSAKFVRNSS